MRRIQRPTGARCCAVAWLFALASAASGQYRFDHFTTDNGLPQNTVASIAQTPDGFLWFATYDGLVRYDGVRFVIFDKASTPCLKCNWFQTLAVDDVGTLWAGTVDGGLVQCEGGVFRTLTTDDRLPGNNVRRLRFLESGAKLMTFNDRDLYVWDDSKGIPIEATPKQTGEFYDSNGVHWLLTPKKVTRTAAGVKSEFAIETTETDVWNHRYLDQSGGLWIGAENNGVFHIHGDRVDHLTAKDGLPENASIHVAGQDAEGGVWMHAESGLFRFYNGRLTQVLGPDGAPIRHVRAVLWDREGTLWIGCNDRGLYRLTRQFLTVMTTKDGLLDNNIYPTFADRAGAVWMGSRDGISKYSHGKVVGYSLQPPNAENPKPIAFAPSGASKGRFAVRSFCQDRAGRMWIGHELGLCRLENGMLYDHSLAVQFAVTDAIHEDRDGAIWAGTQQGLFKLPRDSVAVPVGIASKPSTKWNPRKIEDASASGQGPFAVDHGLPDKRVTGLFQDKKGVLWVGTRRGLARQEGERFIVVGAQEGLLGHRLRCIHEDEAGVLWVGTFDGGLWRIEAGRIVHYSSKDGLHNNGVFQILDDGRGNFWMSSNRGIYRVRKRQLNDFAEGKTTVINSVACGSAEGMLSTECNGERQPAGARTPEGKLWFPTQHGVVVIDPSIVPYNAKRPLIVVESVLVDRKAVSFADRVVLQPGQADLELNFTAPSSLKPENIQFKYRMTGLHADWVDAGQRRSVNYSHLPPGDYTFQVLAANGDGVWNETGASLEIAVLPYLYQRRWFLPICLVAVGAFAAGIVAGRVRELKANTRRLKEQVAARTRDLEEQTQQLEAANKKLETLATLDGLTNIANHRRFKEFLHEEWQRSLRMQTQISLLLMDVDYFKLFNDAYGHQKGDDCLKSVATVLNETPKRSTDLAARYGGEEFAVILADTGAVGANVVAESIRARVEALRIPHSQSSVGPYVTLSVGVATMVAARDTGPDELVAAADKLLYAAKKAGRNRAYSGPATSAKSTVNA